MALYWTIDSRRRSVDVVADGEVSMTAGDLVDHIGDAILEVSARRRVASNKATD